MDRIDPEGRIFIPECRPDGKYRSAQCHKSTGYCWCVNEDNGKPIPGTSTHNVTPDCSTANYRSFKGTLGFLTPEIYYAIAIFSIGCIEFAIAKMGSQSSFEAIA